MPTPSGTLPPEIVQGFEAGLFSLPGRAGNLTTSAVQSVWNVPVILVAFSDQPLRTALYDPSTPEQFFERRLFDTTGTTLTGSVFDYYRWVSGNRIRVVGKVVARVTLPNPKNYYANNTWGLSLRFTPQNTAGFVTAAVQAADEMGVDWRPFDQNHDTYVDMLWVVHSGLPGEAVQNGQDLWSLTSRLTTDWSNSDFYQTRTLIPGAPNPPTDEYFIKVDRFSVMPELSALRLGQPTEIGVYCHEFGHALGLPDLYDTTTLGGGANVGPGNWSLMATGGYGADGRSPEYPSHLGAWPLLYLGWRTSIRPAADTLLTQAPLVRGGPVVEFWFQGEANPEHFLIENRQREGFDRNLPSEGLILYHVDETVMALGFTSNRVNAGITPGLRLVEADGQSDLVTGSNHGDERDPFPGYNGRRTIDDETIPNTRAFGGAITNIALRQIEQVGDDMRYIIQVRSPGWQPATSATGGDFRPSLPSGAANRAVRLDDGSLAMALSEPSAGRPQVVLRSRPREGVWGDPLQVSASPGTANDPTMAALPGGSDLAMVWSDTRHGAGELYYRSRLGGIWTSERRLTDLPGDSRFPSVGVDRFGRVHLAWLYTDGSLTQVRFMSFTYFSPFGMSLAVTRPGDLPDAPVVAAGPDGKSHIFWSNRGTSPSSVWFAKYDPAIGLAAADTVAPSGFAQLAIDATFDASGALHVVWQVSGPGVNEIHYQRRPPGGGPPAPGDTIVSARGTSVQNPTLRVDSGLALHLAFVGTKGGVSQVLYKRRHPGHGWDWGSTEATLVSDGLAAKPALVPTSPDEVSVLYFGFSGETVRLMERRRVVPPSALAVPEPSRPSPPVALRVAPNPLPAGTRLTLELAGGAPPGGSVIDIFDLAGRRLASVPIVAGGGGRIAGVEGSVTGAWPSGVYFVLPRDQGVRAARLVVIR